MNKIIEKIKSYRQFKGRLVIAGVGLFLVLLVADIWSLNRLATLGEQINKFEAASSELRLENQIMQNKIAKLTSLDEIEHRSLLLGFRSIKTIETLKTSDIALNP